MEKRDKDSNTKLLGHDPAYVDEMKRDHLIYTAKGKPSPKFAADVIAPRNKPKGLSR
ncbi:MAG: hypothetical protein AAFR51_03875 [Pseudomonadota bacterium]